jgi:hypothetical protein
VYTNTATAQAGISSEQYITETNMAENGLLRGYIIVRGASTELNNIGDVSFIQADKFGEMPFGGTGGGTTTLQGAYNNSIEPEIITNTTLGALSIQRGSTSDTDNVLEIKNGAGNITAYITGNGGGTFATSANLNSHTTNTSNPHTVTKTQVGLSNVDNTSDVNKPISTATQTALNLKFDTSGISNYATTATIYPYVDVKDPTGFTDPENIVVTYNSTNRTVTLTGTVKALWRGQVVSVLVSGWVSDPHTDTLDQNYFLYYDGSNFVWSTTPWTFDMLQICEVAYKTQAKYAIREVHSFMDYTTHSNLHYTVGTFKKSGGTITGFTPASTVAANRRPTLGSTVIVDEDVPTTNASVSTGSYTRFNLTGSGATAVIAVDQTDFVNTGAGGRANYNLNTAGTWSVAESANNTYGKWFLVNIPVTSDAESQKMRTVWIMPQTVSTTLATITAITPSDINWGALTGAGTQEYVFVGEVIVQSVGGNNWQITSAKVLTGSRLAQISTQTITALAQSVIFDDTNVMLERVINVACVSDAATAVPSTLAVIDGYTPIAGDLVLLRNNTASALQGVYLVQPAATPWTRAVEMDTVLEVTDRIVKVNNGTTYKNTFWTVVTKGNITLGTTAIKFAQQFIDYASTLSLSTAGVLSVTSSPTLTTAITIGTLTGDVTTAGSTFNGSANNTNATTIANNAVTNAKAAQMAANTIKGNNTAGTANAVDMTVAQTLVLIGNTTAQWNANKLQGYNISAVVPTDAQVLTYDTTNSVWTPKTPSVGGSSALTYQFGIAVSGQYIGTTIKYLPASVVTDLNYTDLTTNDKFRATVIDTGNLTKWSYSIRETSHDGTIAQPVTIKAYKNGTEVATVTVAQGASTKGVYTLGSAQSFTEGDELSFSIVSNSTGVTVDGVTIVAKVG